VPVVSAHFRSPLRDESNAAVALPAEFSFIAVEQCRQTSSVELRGKIIRSVDRLPARCRLLMLTKMMNDADRISANETPLMKRCLDISPRAPAALVGLRHTSAFRFKVALRVKVNQFAHVK